jgi:hypothetical protein
LRSREIPETDLALRAAVQVGLCRNGVDWAAGAKGLSGARSGLGECERACIACGTDASKIARGPRSLSRRPQVLPKQDDAAHEMRPERHHVREVLAAIRLRLRGGTVLAQRLFRVLAGGSSLAVTPYDPLDLLYHAGLPVAEGRRGFGATSHRRRIDLRLSPLRGKAESLVALEDRAPRIEVVGDRLICAHRPCERVDRARNALISSSGSRASAMPGALISRSRASR